MNKKMRINLIKRKENLKEMMMNILLKVQLKSSKKELSIIFWKKGTADSKFSKNKTFWCCTKSSKKFSNCQQY